MLLRVYWLVERLLELVDVDLVEAHTGQHVFGQLAAVLALNHHSDVSAAVLGDGAFDCCPALLACWP